MRLSSVGGIIDREGNVRTVVTAARLFHHHVAPGERLFIVPGLLVPEPVPWGMIPFVVASAEQAVADGIWPRKMPKRGIPEEEAAAILRIMRQAGLARAA